MANENRNNARTEGPMKPFRDALTAGAALYCSVFTAATLVSSGLQLLQGDVADDNLHILNRAVVILIAVVAIELAMHAKVRNRAVHWLVVYVPSMLLVFGYVWLTGFVEPLARHAFRDVFLNYTGAALVVGIVLNGVDLVRT